MPSKEPSRSSDKRTAKRHPPRHEVQDSKTAERLGQPAAIVQRAAFAPGSLTAEDVLRLQSAVGNRAVLQLLGAGGPTLESGKGLRSVKVQAKLAVSNPNDVYEQEADRVAKAVTRSINTPVHRQIPEEEEEVQTNSVLQRQEEELKTQSAEYKTSSISGDLETRIKSVRTGGRNLSEDVREPMERAFGVDFGDVRVHTESEADKLNEALSAKAFTTGKDIFFREGEYSPGSDSGRQLIAHELTHVVQQAGSKLNRLKTKGLASSHVSTAISNSPGQTIQRLMTLNTFQKNTSAGTFAIRDPLLKEIDEWIEEYHKHFDPPRNEAERDLMCSILEEITEASGELQIKASDPPMMNTIIEGLAKQARKDKERLVAMASFPKIPVAVSKGEESNIESLTKTMKGDVQSSLTAVAPLIDFAAPDIGDKTTLKIILEVPLPPPGFIGFDLECKAERGEDTVKARLEFLCTGGAKGGPGAKLKGKLGGYIEAQAKDSEKAMNLISYGMYRRLRESSVVPRELANAMWGGSKSRKGWKLAERWAAAIEKGVFGEDSAEQEKYFVETGGIAALEAVVLAGGAVLEPEGFRLEGRRASGRKYTKKSIEALKNAGPAPFPTKRGAQKKLGEGVVTWSGTGKAVLGTMGVVVTLSRSWKTEAPENKGGPLTIDVSGSFRVPVQDLGMEAAIYTLVGKFLVDLYPTIKSLSKQSRDEEKKLSGKKVLKGVGKRIPDPALDLAGILADLSDSSKEWKPQVKIPKPSSKTKGVTRVEGELSLQIKSDVDKNKVKSFALSLSTVSVVGLDAPAISVILSKKKQIFSYKKDL